MKTSRRLYRNIAFAGVLICAAGLLLLQQTGAFSARQTWQEATGYNEIPSEQRGEESASGEPIIKWLGHSGFYIRWAGTTILLDPMLSDHCIFLTRLWPAPVQPGDLPPVDAVLLSHTHYDHLDMPTLEGINDLANIVLPKGSEVFLSQRLREHSNVLGVDIWGSVKVGQLEIHAVPAEHNGARNHPFGSNYKAVGYVIHHGEHSIYFAGDTGNGLHFKLIHEKYAPDIAILPIGAYEPNVILKHYHLNPEDAVLAAEQLQAKRIIPCHFGTFRIALDSPQAALPAFAELAARHSLPWEMPVPYSKDAASK